MSTQLQQLSEKLGIPTFADKAVTASLARNKDHPYASAQKTGDVTKLKVGGESRVAFELVHDKGQLAAIGIANPKGGGFSYVTGPAAQLAEFAGKIVEGIGGATNERDYLNQMNKAVAPSNGHLFSSAFQGAAKAETEGSILTGARKFAESIGLKGTSAPTAHVESDGLTQAFGGANAAKPPVAGAAVGLPQATYSPSL